MNKINKIFLALIVLSIAVASFGLVSASDITDAYETDSDFNGESLAVDDSISGKDHKVIPRMELPRGYENKKAELKKPEIEKEEMSVKVFDVKMEESTDGYDPSKESETSGTFDDLQVEIDNAATGSILHLYRDYNGNYASKIQFHKDLTIDGHGHTLDCLYQGGYSAFYSSSGNITLKNLSIIHGHNDHTDKGGAIYITGSAQYTLINCSLIDNWADDYGGAIYNEVDKPLTLINCLLRGNTADDDSGGAVFSNGEVIIKNSILDNNRAWLDGGAVYCNKNVKVFNSSLTSNVAKGASSQCYGGAICSKEDVFIENCTISNNFAADYGGGVYAKNIYVNQEQSLLSLFAGNTADDNDDGALYAEETLKMSYASLKENKAYEDGGAVLCTDAYLDNCQFLSNHAEGASFKLCEGGAIFAKDDVHIYGNCSFNHNEARYTGGAIDCDDLYVYEPSLYFWCNYIKEIPDCERNVANIQGINFFTNQDIYGNLYCKF